MKLVFYGYLFLWVRGGSYDCETGIIRYGQGRNDKDTEHTEPAPTGARSPTREPGSQRKVRPERVEPTSCCGYQPYHPDMYSCCSDKSGINHALYDVGDQECCDGAILRVGNEGCCDGSIYVKDTHGCCGEENGSIYGIGQLDCCNGHLYDPHSGEVCCGNKVLYDFVNHGCCDGQLYDTQEYDCCNNTLVPVNKFPGCRCQFTDWSSWNQCDSNFGFGYQERHRLWRPKAERPAFALEPDVQTSRRTCPTLPLKKKPGLLSQRRYGAQNDRDQCIRNGAFRLADYFFFETQYFKDIAIVMDESTSIKPHNFERAKSLVLQIMLNMCGGIREYGNRVALVRFSTQVKVDITFNVTSEAQVRRTVKEIEYSPVRNTSIKRGGTTWTAHALQTVYDKILTPRYGWRENKGASDGRFSYSAVETIVVVITDGVSNDPRKSGVRLDQQKARFADKKVKTYAIGVGKINQREIRMLTDENPESIFYMMSWADIDKFSKIIEKVVADREYDPAACLPLSVRAVDDENR